VSRTRVALLAAVLALAGGVLSLRLYAPGAAARPADVPAREAAPVAAPRNTPPVPPPVRDIFQYSRAEEEETVPRRVAPVAPVALPAPPSLAASGLPVPEGPRLIGIVRQGGALKAAIAVDGEVTVVRIGDRAGAYTVLAIDEDDGVRLSDPSGATLTLAPPQS
jgi:hypothetical protein